MFILSQRIHKDFWQYQDEEAVRRRPGMYIGHPEWGELAQQLIDEQEVKDNPDEYTCLDIANGLGHDQAKCIGILLTDKLLMRTWEKRKKERKNNENT